MLKLSKRYKLTQLFVLLYSLHMSGQVCEVGGRTAFVLGSKGEKDGKKKKKKEKVTCLFSGEKFVHVFIIQNVPLFYAFKRDVISYTAVCLSKEMSFRGLFTWLILIRVPHSFFFTCHFLSLYIITIHLGVCQL